MVPRFHWLLADQCVAQPTRMTKLKDKIQDALDECRMLILGGQVLIAFTAEAVLEPGFGELSRTGQALCIAGMVALVVAVGILMAPAAYHRLACDGLDLPRLHPFTTRIATTAMVPFALGLSCAVYIVAERSAGASSAAILGISATFVSFLALYVFPVLSRKPRGGARVQTVPETTLADKIRHVLTEARMVLPGAQALLGFGAISVLMDRFKSLPEDLKLVHLGGLSAIAVAVMLLMTPAAYHRIAEHGELSERFHKIAARLLLLAMGFLALGMAAAVWLVVQVGTGSALAAQIAAGAILLGFWGMWFGWPLLRRASDKPRVDRPDAD